jgi:hypothetical protein
MRCLPSPAASAIAAGDLEGDADQRAGLDALDPVGDVDHLRHAFMAERQRPLEGSLAPHYRGVEITRRDRHWADQRITAAGERRLGHLEPVQLARAVKGQLTHRGHA